MYSIYIHIDKQRIRSRKQILYGINKDRLTLTEIPHSLRLFILFLLMASAESNLPLATILHLLTIKLTSSNYLLWKNKIRPLLSYQNLLGYVDGSFPSPPATTIVEGKTSLNPKYGSIQINELY